ncbi:hypothetical protein QF010_001347 [Pseudomonas silensiensis]
MKAGNEKPIDAVAARVVARGSNLNTRQMKPVWTPTYHWQLNQYLMQLGQTLRLRITPGSASDALRF